MLPSANLKFDLTRELVARLAVSKTMSRADYSSLSPAVTLNNLDLTGSGGNADLKPIRSTNLTRALEWYFAPQSILSLGVFYMDMPSYVTYGYNIRPAPQHDDQPDRRLHSSLRPSILPPRTRAWRCPGSSLCGEVSAPWPTIPTRMGMPLMAASSSAHRGTRLTRILL